MTFAVARPKPGWLLDETASAGDENLDPAHVARYDTKEDAGAAAEVELLRGRGLDVSSVVVDLGAGTGQFTLAVAPACARVVAVDVSLVMLDRLRANVADSPFCNVEVVRAGFLTYHHAAAPADVIYTRYALHHLPDAWKAVALARMRRMLRTGGLVRLWDVVYNFAPAEAEDRLEAWCATGGDGIVGEWGRAELEDHIRDEHSTFTWLMEPMIERAGFQIEQAVYSDDGIYAQYLLRTA